MLLPLQETKPYNLVKLLVNYLHLNFYVYILGKVISYEKDKKRFEILKMRVEQHKAANIIPKN